MYWIRMENDPNVSRLTPEDDDYDLVVGHLDFQYKLGLEAALGKSRSDSAQNPSPVVQMKKKPLTFYKNIAPNSPPELFEVELDLSTIDKNFGNKHLTNYEWTRVYLVRICEDKSQDSPWYMLNGESSVLHELNAKYGGVRIDDLPSSQEYLDFFCSFLSAEEGVFALISDTSHLRDLEDDDVFGRDLYQRRHFAVHRTYTDHETVPWAPIETEIVAKLAEIERSNRDPKTPPTPEEKLPEQKLTLRNMRGVILYGRHIFESEFQVSQAGMVEMAKDAPLLTDLAVRLHNVLVHKRSGLVLFTKSRKTTEVPGAVFMKHVRESDGIAYCSNIVVGGKVEFEPVENLVGLECSNVRFLNDVIFDHCKVLSVARFKHCRFLGSVSAVGTHFHSQLGVEGCEIFALQEGRGGKQAGLGNKTSQVRPGQLSGRYAIALNLDHARIEGSLSLEGLITHGSLRARHLTAQTDVNFSGLKVLPLVARNDIADGKKAKLKAAPGGGSVLLDLQCSSFAGSLNLGISVEKDVGLRKGKHLRRTRVTVCGDCRFDTMSIGKSLIIEGLAVVKPNAEVDLTDYGGRGGTLSMPNVTVRGNVQSWDYDSWDLTGAAVSLPLVVDGTIDLKWSKIDGYVDLRGAHVTGDLACAGIRAAWLTLEHSGLSNVDSNDETPRRTEDVVWAKYAILNSTLRSRPIGNAPSKWIEQFSERMSIIEGSLNLGNAIIPGGVQLRGASIVNSIDVYRGAQVGFINALPCFGIHIEWTEALAESGAKRQVPKNRTVVKQSASLGRLSIRDSTVAGPVNLWGAKIGPRDTQIQNGAPKPAIDISTSSIRGGLYLHPRSSWEGQRGIRELLDSDDQESPKYNWVDHLGKEIKGKSRPEMALDYFWQTISDVFHTTVNGDVDILATEIGADLDLTNTEAKGRIRLNDSYFKCDVKAVTCFQELEPKITKSSNTQQDEALRIELQTRCSRFEFQSLRCDGDLMLAGLVVSTGVDGRNAVVRGHGEFNCDWIVKKPSLLTSTRPEEERGRAYIENTLELCGLEIGLLRIDGQGFKNRGMIDLARATISTLEISEPLPKEINLQSIKVSNWEITKSKKEEKGKRLIALLKATKDHYDSGPYQSIEASLAAEGKDEDANEVHRDKNWRELDKKFWHEWEALDFGSHPVLRSFALLFFALATVPLVIPRGSCIQAAGLLVMGLTFYFGPFIKLAIWDGLSLGLVMGFGTRLLPAFLLWLTLASALAFVLSDPRNVQPTFAAVNVGLGKIKLDTDNATDSGSEIQKARKELQKIIPQEWGFGNAFWLALDITVPLVPFNLHDEWEPRESNEETVIPCCSYGQLWRSPKTFASISTAISWIIWSLMATGLVGLIRTRN